MPSAASSRNVATAGSLHDSRRGYLEHKLRVNLLDSSVEVSLGAEVDQSLVGFLLARVWTGEFGVTEPVAVLDTVGVHPDFQGQGVGRALLRQLYVNLRGLGINRTLVLLNGRRIVYGGTGANSAVDLNMIPTSIIERIEVLKDGGSAIYGADAVAGVVNIITRRDFDGTHVETKYGQTAESDGEEMAAASPSA